MVMGELQHELPNTVGMVLLIITQRNVMMEMQFQEMGEARLELLSFEVMELSTIMMKDEMTEIQCQEMAEAPHESLSTEVMALLTIMKSVMTTTHHQMMDVIKHVSLKIILFEQVEV